MLRCEPDGYAQLSRRGPFDRLLLTQWALLDVVPEELLRRAASNELLFHELARKEPKTNQAGEILFWKSFVVTVEKRRAAPRETALP